jgi:hypothetical protein
MPASVTPTPMTRKFGRRAGSDKKASRPSGVPRVPAAREERGRGRVMIQVGGAGMGYGWAGERWLTDERVCGGDGGAVEVDRVHLVGPARLAAGDTGVGWGWGRGCGCGRVGLPAAVHHGDKGVSPRLEDDAVQARMLERRH